MPVRLRTLFASFQRFFAIFSLVLAILVAGCNSSSPKISIALSPASPQNAIGGQVIMVTATLTHDTKVAGVAWSLTGPGALSGPTTSAVTYTAPATISAAGTATITATSVTDPTIAATLTINLAPISVTLNPNAAQTLDQTKTVAVTATVNSDPATKGVTWSLNAGAAGTLSNQTATSVTYNAPASVAAASSPVLTATSISDNTKTATLTINLVPPPVVSTTSLASGTVGAVYSATFAAAGGVTPDTWTITIGTLPAGLLLNASTGAITGTPTASGTSNITAKVTDADGLTATKGFTITIDQQPAITSASSVTFTVNTAGSFTVTSTAFPTAALTETGALPAGVTFLDNGNGTATLGGIATTSGAFPITIKATNGIGTAATQNFTLTVGQAPAITSGASTTFTVGSAGTFSVTTTGFPAPSLTETGALPGGVTFVDNGNGTAKLSGTPAAATGGTYSITIKAHNGSGADATQTFTLTVNQAPAITSATATSFSVSALGSFTVTATGFPKPALAETGALPSGVTFVDNGNGTATLGGTASAQGTFPITITASNGVGSNATQAFTLTVNTAPAFTSVNHATFTVGTAGTFTVTATGTPTPSLSETGALPTGVTFNSTTGVLTGTPAAGTGKTYSITFTASNGVGTNATQTFTLTVDQAPAVTSAASTTFTVGTFASFTVMTSGFPVAALTETAALPSGVTFTDNGNGTATLSGTPAAGTAATYPITITANNGVAPNGTQSFTLTVNTAPVITSGASTTFTVGVLGTFTVTTTGAPTPALTETGALPNGVNFTDNGNGTATLGGTPTVGGTYPITIKATNASGNTTQNFTLTVDQSPAITSSTTVTFNVGSNGSFTVTTTGTPSPSLVQTGTLPSGVTFTDNGNGTGTLSGIPATGTAASYPITFTATNGIGAPAVQSFTLTVSVASANACAGYGSGNESALKGSYALLIQGMNGSGAPLNPFAAAASFAADGTGKITAGEVDVNQSGSSGSQHLTVSATGSSYKLGSDNRGCMTLFFGGNNQVVFHFVVGGISAGIASKGRVIEFDDTDGTGGRGAGILRLQTASDFVSSHLKARYAFGLDGFDFTNGHVAVGGAFTTASGGTTITNGYLDVDDAGSLSGPITGGTGSISSISATTGRATAVFNAGAGATFNLAVYVVNANELFVVSTDTLSASTVLNAGRAIVTGSSFSNSSLNGKYILHLSSSGGGSASVSLGLLTLSGGTINGTLYQYQGGVASSNPLNGGTYNVNTTSGRVSITGAGNHNPVLYLPTPTDGIS